MGLRIDERRVKLFMAIRGIETQDELAKRAGLHPATLVKLFKGSNFTAETLDKLARAFECNPLDLIAVEGYPDPLDRAPAFAAC